MKSNVKLLNHGRIKKEISNYFSNYFTIHRFYYNSYRFRKLFCQRIQNRVSIFYVSCRSFLPSTSLNYKEIKIAIFQKFDSHLFCQQFRHEVMRKQEITLNLNLEAKIEPISQKTLTAPSGAGEGSRTPYVHFGKVTFYR